MIPQPTAENKGIPYSRAGHRPLRLADANPLSTHWSPTLLLNSYTHRGARHKSPTLHTELIKLPLDWPPTAHNAPLPPVPPFPSQRWPGRTACTCSTKSESWRCLSFHKLELFLLGGKLSRQPLLGRSLSRLSASLRRVTSSDATALAIFLAVHSLRALVPCSGRPGL
jgi:hypothetical protein